MQILRSNIQPLLIRNGITNSGTISQYWINGRKQSVSGIWLVYTDIKPYYTVCQLNCGIYENHFYIGIQISSRAKCHLHNALEYISSNEEEFLWYFSRLNENRVILYNTVELNSDSTISNLKNLESQMQVERNWFSLGEWYSRDEYLQDPLRISSRVTHVFATLYPLYLVFAGRRPLGKTIKEKLLRIEDTKTRSARKMEQSLISQTYDMTEQERDEIIAEIDKRNKGYKPKRVRLFGGSYRRNPVLSTLLKEKYGDHCQICDLILEVEKGFFCDTHHVVPLKNGGTDTSDNVVVICPNHHRLLDRSVSKIVSKTPLKMVIENKHQQFAIDFK